MNRSVCSELTHLAGNVDAKVYARVPDNRVQLTEEGRRQAVEAGQQLKGIIGEGQVRFFVSPYVRSRQTFQNILTGMGLAEGSAKFTFREDPRLREQDWGNLQVPEKVVQCMKERRAFGSFYYRFKNGESGADVYDRVTSFWASLQREMKYRGTTPPPFCPTIASSLAHHVTPTLALVY